VIWRTDTDIYEGMMKQTIAWMLLVGAFGASSQVFGLDAVPYDQKPEPVTEVIVSTYDAVCD
jgi:hypothetical protein